jgi:3-deoxy-D-manno-octulosonate 8-phosphate phosphatase (KDO 8-P phosphatase)
MELTKDSKKNIANIKLLILDVDGVMTDGKMVYDEEGKQLKYFDVKDGYGLKLLMRTGIKVAIITASNAKAVLHRAQDLGIETVYQGARNKKDAFEGIIKKFNITPQDVAYIGDDVIDLPLLKTVGFSAAVADAVDDVKEHVDYITGKSGGCGAVREVCELILKVQGRWEEVIKGSFKAH